MFWKPVCEWMSSVAHRTASSVGLSEPAAKGVIVRGISEAATRRSKVQWYEPCEGDGSGMGAGSLTEGDS